MKKGNTRYMNVTTHGKLNSCLPFSQKSTPKLKNLFVLHLHYKLQLLLLNCSKKKIYRFVHQSV